MSSPPPTAASPSLPETRDRRRSHATRLTTCPATAIAPGSAGPQTLLCERRRDRFLPRHEDDGGLHGPGHRVFGGAGSLQHGRNPRLQAPRAWRSRFRSRSGPRSSCCSVRSPWVALGSPRRATASLSKAMEREVGRCGGSVSRARGPLRGPDYAGLRYRCRLLRWERCTDDHSRRLGGTRWTGSTTSTMRAAPSSSAPGSSFSAASLDCSPCSASGSAPRRGWLLILAPILAVVGFTLVQISHLIPIVMASQRAASGGADRVDDDDLARGVSHANLAHPTGPRGGPEPDALGGPERPEATVSPPRPKLVAWASVPMMP
jgi:hypothetical protein